MVSAAKANPRYYTEGSDLYLPVPCAFDFTQCLKFLNRSHHESLHSVADGHWVKLVRLAGTSVLIQVSESGSFLVIRPLNTVPNRLQQDALVDYILEVFDLNRDLGPFYDHMKTDPLMGKLCGQYYGLRLLGIPDLFEALCWCIIGQQINLTFAYKLKQRLVFSKGEKLHFRGEDYFLFPSARVVAGMSVEELSKWQYSASKASYLVGVAREISQGIITRDSLLKMSAEDARKSLMRLRGIGEWSAHYVMMKCLRVNTAYPVGDVGLQNAIKIQKGLHKKPLTSELLKMGENWHPWQAYATFYLWHSLIK